MHLADIPAEHVPALATILQFLPNEDSREQSKRFSQGTRSLPSLLRPSRLERLLLPPCGHLCKLHKNVDSTVVDVVLHHIQIEVGVRLNNLISQCQLLSSEQYARVTRLRTLHALWLAPAEYEMTFLSSVQSLKWKYQTDRCEGCILSHLSSDLEVLLDLRCAIRSRMTTRFVAKHGNPRLQIWAQSWIHNLAKHLWKKTGQEIDLDSLLSRNEEEAAELRQVRAKIHAVRKDKLKIVRVGRKRGVAVSTQQFSTTSSDVSPVSSPTDANQGEENLNSQRRSIDDVTEGRMVDDPEEVELEVIHPYAALVSTPYLPNGAVAPTSKYDSRTGTASANASTKGQHPYLHPHQAKEKTSVYSFNTMARSFFDAHMVINEEEEYVLPRELWKEPQQQQRQQPSCQLRCTPDPQPERSSVVAPAESWVTQCLGSVNEIYSPAPSTQHFNYQQGRCGTRISGPRGHSHQTPKRNPADTYVELFNTTPFDSELFPATLAREDETLPSTTYKEVTGTGIGQDPSRYGVKGNDNHQRTHVHETQIRLYPTRRVGADRVRVQSW
ncbi:uncharacterized protein Z518_02549 [Rhinocladiella mackenziei CBS 650.93]|uniref:Uncharacterized protein n=1 Tax=Rhinocladiella mackenziei CBS 650.93 TaxID=1442369 RepID=A0A0D2JF93_9EURO|nr:uncharacterized protein Z518_02549 [Rhinocladiella mackenziei CBS 650.93]KIX07895.1 hypothetical protein Z518_02549 [Rhinocladiella mackenziei CBS 650.93]